MYITSLGFELELSENGVSKVRKYIRWLQKTESMKLSKIVSFTYLSECVAVCKRTSCPHSHCRPGRQRFFIASLHYIHALRQSFTEASVRLPAQNICVYSCCCLDQISCCHMTEGRTRKRYLRITRKIHQEPIKSENGEYIETMQKSNVLLALLNQTLWRLGSAQGEAPPGRFRRANPRPHAFSIPPRWP